MNDDRDNWDDGTLPIESFHLINPVLYITSWRSQKKFRSLINILLGMTGSLNTNLL